MSAGTRRSRAMVVMLYHGIDSGEAFYDQMDAVRKEYVITKEQFRDHLQLYQRLGCEVLPLDHCMRGMRSANPSSASLVLSFDDGEASCYTTAAPLLEQYGYRGSFFVVVDWIERPGYMTAGQLRELHQRGHGVYSHSMTHPYFTQISDEQIMREMCLSKERLEQVLGSAVRCFSVPTGQYDERFERCVQDTGYSEVCISREGYNHIPQGPAGPRFLCRFAVRAYTSQRDVKWIISRRHVAQIFLRVKAMVLSVLKKLIGRQAYERVRERIVRFALSGRRERVYCARGDGPRSESES